MDPQLAKYLMLAIVFGGATVLVPIIMALLRHQQRMAELIHQTTDRASGVTERLDQLEKKIDALIARPELVAPPNSVVPPAEINVRM